MAPERYVLLGLAQVGAGWFRELARWSTSAALPVEFVKTVSVEEVRVRLASGRAFSALVVEDSVVGLDRDLVELAREVGCAVVVVEGARALRAWAELGVSAVLPGGFGRAELLETLAQVATPISRAERALAVPAAPLPGRRRGRLVAVTGAPGAGRSTVAAALAQGLAADARWADMVCLADLVLRADQGMLHDVGDVVPGVVELVEAHRLGAPDPDEVRGLTWQIADRGYHLLLGLRRQRDWTALRPRALEAALDGLRRAFHVVVAEVDPDLEGEQECGSIDVEERNVMARTTVAAAEIVVVVGRPGVQGLHRLLGVLGELAGHGVAPERLAPVINNAPRGPRARAELTAAFGALAEGFLPGVPSPLFSAHSARLERSLRDGARLPGPLASALAQAVRRLLDLERPAPPGAAAEPAPVRPSRLGAWRDDGAPAQPGVAP